MNEHDANQAIDAALSAPAAPVAWAVLWGDDPVRMNSVHIERGTAERVAARIVGASGIRPLVYGDANKALPAAPVAQGVSKADIRRVFLANGFSIKDGCDDLKPYVYAAAEALLALRQTTAAPVAPITVTEEMHVAACKVLTRATGMDGLPQRMLNAMLAAAPAAPVAPLERPLHLGACITDGKLHATVMRREDTGSVTVVAMAEMDAASLQNRDCVAQMMAPTDAAPKGVQGEPVAWREIVREYLDARDAESEPTAVGASCRAIRAESALRSLIAAPAAPVARADGMPESRSERHLRRLLAARVAMPGTYLDDGEASGSEHGVSIDFMREPVANIDAKLRALNVARAECAAPATPTPPVAQPLSNEAAMIALREWAVNRWREEVENRPLVNVHRRTLDDTWRQVMRYAGLDPDEVVGLRHDELVRRAHGITKGEA